MSDKLIKVCFIKSGASHGYGYSVGEFGLVKESDFKDRDGKNKKGDVITIKGLASLGIARTASDSEYSNFIAGVEQGLEVRNSARAAAAQRSASRSLAPPVSGVDISGLLEVVAEQGKQIQALLSAMAPAAGKVTKTLLFLLVFLGGMIFRPAQVVAQDYLVTTDSTVLTNQDTQITYLNTLSSGKSPWMYSVHVVSDSLTGSTAGTVYVQFTNDGYTWLNHSTSLTLDGAAQQTQSWDGTLYARRMRVYAITPSGSKTINYRLKAILKKTVSP